MKWAQFDYFFQKRLSNRDNMRIKQFARKTRESGKTRRKKLRTEGDKTYFSTVQF